MTLFVYCQLRARIKRELPSESLCNRAREQSIDLPSQVTASAIEKLITATKAAIQEYHKEAATKRQEFILQQENLAEDANEHTKANPIKQIRKLQQKEEAYR